jgi:hypothetical protein
MFTPSHIAQYFHPTPWTWESWFHPQRWLVGVSRSSSVFPSISWGRSEFEPRFLAVWWVELPLLAPTPHPVPLCIWALTKTYWEDESLLWIKLSIGVWWDLLPVVCGTHPGDKGGEKKSQSLQYWQCTPKKCYRKQRYGTLRCGSNSLLCWHRLSGLMSKGWALRKKGVSPYVPLQAGYRGNKI